jgi:hypothetical protein
MWHRGDPGDRLESVSRVLALMTDLEPAIEVM